MVWSLAPKNRSMELRNNRQVKPTVRPVMTFRVMVLPRMWVAVR